MDTPPLVPFEDAEIQQFGEFDASKFRIKELRIKDLHKNLCKKPYFRVRRVSDASTSAAQPLDNHGERYQHGGLSAEAHEADPEISDHEYLASVPLKVGSERREPRRKFPAADLPQASKRFGKKEKQVPAKLRDSKCHTEPRENDRRYLKGGAAKSKVKNIRLPAKSSDGKRGHFFEVPIRTYQADPAVAECADPAPVDLPASKRGTKPRRSREAINYSEDAESDWQRLEARTDTDCEGRSRTPKSKMKWSKKSPHASREEVLEGGDKKSKIAEKKKLKHSHSSPDTKKEKSSSQRQVRIPKVRIPIRKLKGGYTSEDATSEVDLDADSLGIGRPTFVAEMKHSNVITCFWLSIPREFAKHLPDHDEFIVLQDGKGLKWETNYLAAKKGLSGGWRRFSIDHHLELGDVVVFELVKPLKFLVHITRVSDGGRAIVTARGPVRETVKKVPKPRFSPNSRKNSSLHSALFSSRKRLDREAFESKFPKKKPHLADSHEQQQQDERCVDNGVPTGKKRDVTDPYENDYALSSSEESQGEEEPEILRGASASKLKRSSYADGAEKKGTPVARKSPLLLSSKQHQDGPPLLPKAAVARKKSKAMVVLSSTDEDHSTSDLKADSVEQKRERPRDGFSEDVEIDEVSLAVGIFPGQGDMSDDIEKEGGNSAGRRCSVSDVDDLIGEGPVYDTIARELSIDTDKDRRLEVVYQEVILLGEKSDNDFGDEKRDSEASPEHQGSHGIVPSRPISNTNPRNVSTRPSEWNNVFDVVKAITAAGESENSEKSEDDEAPLCFRPHSSSPRPAKQEWKTPRRKHAKSPDFEHVLSSADDKDKWVFAKQSKPKASVREEKKMKGKLETKAVTKKTKRSRADAAVHDDEDEGEVEKNYRIVKEGKEVKPRKSSALFKNWTRPYKPGSHKFTDRRAGTPDTPSGVKGRSKKRKLAEKRESKHRERLTSGESEVELSSDSHRMSRKKTPSGWLQDTCNSDPCTPPRSAEPEAKSDDTATQTPRARVSTPAKNLKLQRTAQMSSRRPQGSVTHSQTKGKRW